MSGYPIGAMYDPRADFNQPQLDAADAHKIESRAEQLAADGFDRGDKFTSDFLGSECENDVRSFVLAAWAYLQTDRGNVDARLRAVDAAERLRERFVKEDGHFYRDAAESELTDEGGLMRTETPKGADAHPSADIQNETGTPAWVPCPHFPDRPCWPMLCADHCQDVRYETSTGTILVEPAEPSSVRDNASPDVTPNLLAVLKVLTAFDELYDAAIDALEFAENQEDVDDGDYGVPVPNRAMRVASSLREAIAVAEAAHDLIDKIRGKA